MKGKIYFHIDKNRHNLLLEDLPSKKYQNMLCRLKANTPSNMKLHEETNSNLIIKDSIKTFSYSFFFNLFNVQLQKYMHIIYCWGCHI